MDYTSIAANKVRINSLSAKGVIINVPESVFVGEEVHLDNIEPGVIIGLGSKILGGETMIGADTEIQGAAVIKNCLIGRNCNLAAGEYSDSVLLDNCGTVGWARVRGHSAWEEESRIAHNVDSKTTVLGYKTTLGSLINFPNVLMLGGTSPLIEVGAEVGSGTINFNFLPFGATVGAQIKPSAVIGSIESPFLSCEGAPIRYVFIGGHSSIVAPVVIGLGSVVAAKTRVNPGIYGEEKLIGGGNIERPMELDVSKVRVLKDMTPKYEILIHQMATTAAFRRWCGVRIAWAKRNNLDDFEIKLFEKFGENIDEFMNSLESYGDNIAKYLLADDKNSRPESLEKNREIADQWNEEIKAKIRKEAADETGFAEALKGFDDALDRATLKTTEGDKQFYGILAELSYNSDEVKAAREYFTGMVETIVHLSKN